MDRKGQSVTTWRGRTVLCLAAALAMGWFAGSVSAQVCSPDACPPGAALVDGDGDFSGWCVSGNAGAGVSVTATQYEYVKLFHGGHPG